MKKTVCGLIMIINGLSFAEIPFRERLERANVEVELKDKYIEEYGLLIGNGDLNGIVFNDNGALAVRLTKNDVWDARLPTEKDNTLPSMRRLKEMVQQEGWPPPHLKPGWAKQRIVPSGEVNKPYSYDLYPYPCPVSCGNIRIGKTRQNSRWENIRALDTTQCGWETKDNVTVMSLAGSAQASVGYASNGLKFNSDEYPQLKVKLRGSANSKYFIQLFQNGNQSVFSSLWIDSPQTMSENILQLPAGKQIDTIHLFAMTEDGKPAQVEFSKVEFCSADGSKKLNLDLYAPQTSSRKAWWTNIRKASTTYGWETTGETTTMSLSGDAQASVGYASKELNFSTDEYPNLKVTLRGSANSKYFIQLFQKGTIDTFSSLWIDSPQTMSENTLHLPAGQKIDAVYLYAMTEDGGSAQVEFSKVEFCSADGSKKLNLDLYAPKKSNETKPKLKGNLDLRTATVTASQHTLPAPVEVRALAHCNAVLLLTDEEIHLVPGGQTFLPKAQSGTDQGVEWMVQQIPGDVDWPGMSYAVAAARHNGRAAVAVVTSLESADPKLAAIKLSQEVVRESTAISKHEQTWNKFWSRSGVQLEEPMFENIWYRQLYFLRCITKPGVQCPALYYSLTSDTPMWHGDYHLNYNLQSTFWSTLSCNHPELMEPYSRLIKEYLPRAEWLAGRIYETEGAFYPHILFAYETDPLQSKSHNNRQFIHHVWGMTLGLGAFGVQPMWQQYKYWPDTQRLREEIWPVMRSTALFYVNFMEACERDVNGKIRLGPTTSPEIHPWSKEFKLNYNCAFDISQISYLFNAVIEGSRVLGTDMELSQRCKTLLAAMPDYPVDPEKNVVVDVENSSVGTLQNIPGPYTPVYPGDVINWWSDGTLKDLFTRTIPTVVAPGNGNAYVMGPVSRARLSMPDAHGYTLKLLQERVSPNGAMGMNPWHEVDRSKRYYNSFGMYSEVAAASFAINELMIQSVGDIIRLFPAWDTTKDAAFKTLRTQGGFLVSASFKDGKVQPFIVDSTVGGTLRILCPWPKIGVTLNGTTKTLEPGPSGIISLNTRKGMELSFSPAD